MMADNNIVRKAPTYAVGKLVLHDDLVLVAKALPVSVVERVKTFEPKQGDVLMVTFPKAGTFWIMEMVYHISNSSEGVTPSTTHLMDRVRILEMHNPDEELPYIDILMAQDPPRLMCTHLPGRYYDDMLSKGLTKVIHVVRDPRDVLVSSFHFYRDTLIPIQYKGTIAEFYQHFKNSELLFGDYFRHAYEWKVLAEKYPEQVQKITFEQMKKQPQEIIQQLADFLGHSLTPEQVEQISELTSFQEIKKNKYAYPSNFKCFNYETSHTLRKGEAGDWVNHFTPEMENDFEDLIRRKSEEYNMQF